MCVCVRERERDSEIERDRCLHTGKQEEKKRKRMRRERELVKHQWYRSIKYVRCTYGLDGRNVPLLASLTVVF